MTFAGARLIEQALVAVEEQIAAASDERLLPILHRDLRYWSARRSSMQIMPTIPAPATVEFGVRATPKRTQY